MRVSLVVLLVLCWMGCSGAASTVSRTDGMRERITVEGQVAVRGNEPFTGILLQTDQSNYYVLDVDDARRASLVGTLPARYRVTGLLYGAEWGGKRYAHLRPLQMERR